MQVPTNFSVMILISLLCCVKFVKGVYPYEYMDGWDKFNETSIPSKESFYSNLTMENISETDYRHANTYLKHLNLIIWVIIMIYTYKVILYY